MTVAGCGWRKKERKEEVGVSIKKKEEKKKEKKKGDLFLSILVQTVAKIR